MLGSDANKRHPLPPLGGFLVVPMSNIVVAAESPIKSYV